MPVNPYALLAQRRRTLQEEEDESLLDSISRGAMSGAAYLGESLDKPMAAVRGLLAGRPEELLNLVPFSDTLGLTSSEGMLGGTAFQMTDDEDTVYGRDLLETWGVLNPNVEGFGGKGDWANADWDDAIGDVLGFGIDMVGPPVALGGKALTASGQLARKAGLLDEAVAAAKQTGQGAAAGRMQTLQQALDSARPEVRAGLQDAVEAEAARGGRTLNDVLKERIGHRAVAKLPGIDATVSLDRVAEPIATAVGAFVNPVLNSKPAAVLSQAFNKASGGFGTRPVQRAVGSRLAQYTAEGEAAARGPVGELATAISRNRDEVMRVGGGQLVTDADGVARVVGGDANTGLYRVLELDTPLGPELTEARAAYHAANNSRMAQLRELGVKEEELVDSEIEYVARTVFGMESAPTGASGASGRLLSGNDPRAQLERAVYLKDGPGGTGALREFGKASVDADGVPIPLADLRRKAQEFVQPERDKLTSRLIQAIRDQNRTTTGLQRQLDAETARINFGVPDSGTLHHLQEQHALASRPIEELTEGVKLADEMKAMADKPEQITSFVNSLSPESRAAGIYVDPFDAIQSRATAAELTGARAKTLMDALSNRYVTNSPAKANMSSSVGAVVDAAGLDRNQFLETMARRADPDSFNVPDVRAMAAQPLSDTVAADLLLMNRKATGPDPTNALLKGYDSLTNLWKSLQTNVFPAFSVRNLGGGQARESLGGLNPAEQARALGLARAMSTSGDLTPDMVQRAYDIPIVQQILTERGLPADRAGDVLREISHKYIPNQGQGYGMDMVESAAARGEPGIQSMDQMLGSVGMAGGPQGRTGFNLRKYGRTAIGRTPETNLNPINTRGVGDTATTTFGPGAAGEMLGEHVEDMNRLTPFYAKLQQGMDPAQARRDVLKSQFDYSSGAYTGFENEYMRRLVPFYKFARNNIPYVAEELATNPGGLTASMFRAQPASDRVRSDEQVPLPDHVAQSLAIPLGTNEDGSTRFLAGLGLMEEDILGLLEPASPVRGLLFEAMGRLNPVIKLGGELATGQSFFQRGRELDEMDPTAGRLVANISDAITGETTKSAAPLMGSGNVEAVLSNSPLSRALSTLRTLTDKRKRDNTITGLPGDALIANLLTGIRVSDVTEAQMDRQLQEAIGDMYSGMGGRSFANTYIPDEVKARMTPEQKSTLERLRILERQLRQRRDLRRVAQ